MLSLPEGELLGGRYKIAERLGQGGMGTVYLGIDATTGQQIAVKVLSIDNGADHGMAERGEERFRKETVLARRIQHKNVVQTLDFISTGRVQAMIMEYVEGSDLSKFMRRAPLPARQVLAIMMQSAFGLEAIHNAGIVHRDLKPENILVSFEGVIKISDFGVARQVGTQTLTPDGMMVGSAKYLAPEYIELGDCDHRADIFALGLVCYELSSGAAPYDSDGRIQSLMKRLRNTVRPLREVNPNVPPPLAEVVDRCLSINLMRRFQSCSELLAALKAIETKF